MKYCVKGNKTKILTGSIWGHRNTRYILDKIVHIRKEIGESQAKCLNCAESHPSTNNCKRDLFMDRREDFMIVLET